MKTQNIYGADKGFTVSDVVEGDDNILFRTVLATFGGTPQGLAAARAFARSWEAGGERCAAISHLTSGDAMRRAYNATRVAKVLRNVVERGAPKAITWGTDDGDYDECDRDAERV